MTDLQPLPYTISECEECKALRAENEQLRTGHHKIIDTVLHNHHTECTSPAWVWTIIKLAREALEQEQVHGEGKAMCGVPQDASGSSVPTNQIGYGIVSKSVLSKMYQATGASQLRKAKV